MKRILICPDSMKGTRTAIQAAKQIQAGIKRAGKKCPAFSKVTVDLAPVADGGEGFAKTLGEALGAKRRKVNTIGPLGEPGWEAEIYMSDKTAIIEGASIGVATMVPEFRNPWHTTSAGLGLLIKAAIKKGAKKIIVGIGGSASQDLGFGMLQALGVRFIGCHAWARACKLDSITSIDTSGLYKPIAKGKVEILVASDVTNPLLGKDGAAKQFAFSKFEDDGENMTRDELREQLRLLDATCARAVKRLGITKHNEPGAGAAGGIGLALIEFLGAELRPGIDLVLDTIKFDKRVKRADLIITGEGCLDKASISGGKVIGKLAARCEDKPVIVVCGKVEREDHDRKVTDAQMAGVGITQVHQLAGTDFDEKKNGLARLVEQALLQFVE